MCVRERKSELVCEREGRGRSERKRKKREKREKREKRGEERERREEWVLAQ